MLEIKQTLAKMNNRGEFTVDWIQCRRESASLSVRIENSTVHHKQMMETTQVHQYMHI